MTQSVFLVHDSIQLEYIISKCLSQVCKLDLNISEIENSSALFQELEYITIADDDIFMITIPPNTPFKSIELSRKIRQKNQNCFIIFLSDTDQFSTIILNNRIYPFAYLLKKNWSLGLLEKQMTRVLKDIYETMLRRYSAQYIQLKSGTSVLNVNIEEITYIETLKTKRNFVEIYTLNNQLTIRKSISKIREILTFPYIYTNLKSLIINLRNIQQINRTLERITFVNGAEIYVGRKIIDKIRSEYEKTDSFTPITSQCYTNELA